MTKCRTQEDPHPTKTNPVKDLIAAVGNPKYSRAHPSPISFQAPPQQSTGPSMRKVRRTETSAADLRGRCAISYLRYSALTSKPRTSLRRQDQTLQAILDFYGMTPDRSMTDEAISAAKGHHRARGKLAELIRMAKADEIPIGTPIIIEAMDRLVRQKLTVSLDLLTTFTNKGLI